MRLLGIPFSTNVERVRLALGGKGLEAELVQVPPDDRGAIVAASGQSLVPVLIDGDLVVHDSLAILRYLEELRPEPALWPAAPAARAEVDVFLDWFDRVWKVPPNAIEALERSAEPDRAALAAHAAELRRSLPRFEALLTARDHLLGPLTAADLAAWPFLRYGLGVDADDGDRFHHILAEHLRLGPDFPRLRAWIRRIDALPRAGTLSAA